MKIYLFSLLFILTSIIPFDAISGGRCTGSRNCTACTNCSRCAHCGAGGTCGVCAPRSSKASSSPSPTPSSKASKSSGGTVHVKGYYRKDGTYVRPHTRKK